MKTYFQRIRCVVPQSEYHKFRLREHTNDLSVVFVFGYSEFEIPKGSTFNYLEMDGSTYKVNGILKYVTQSFNFSFDNIPYGWQTVCVINFSEKFDFIEPVPTLQSLYDESKEMILGFDDTFEDGLS